ncbi:MAG TPA: P-loop NTPase [Candidatus Deferrimicrobium sp.]|nr:P-loop NTPase [Candidatus Deferrimicrobium sp.]
MTIKTNPPTIAVTGGKGGTGKTTVAINLAYIFRKQGFKVLFLDCDVDAPNAAILLGAELKVAKDIKSFLPKFNDNCIGCGDCQKACQPHALLNIPKKKPLIFPEICTGCEACKLICKYNAVESDLKVIGKILTGTKYGIDLVVGELEIGEPKSAEVVRAVRDYANEQLNQKKYDIIMIDTAPGAHCDIIHALDGSKIVLSVTEPTPFGTHDLKRILELITYLSSKPISNIIINRSDLTAQKQPFDEIAEQFHTPILGEIPMSREIQLSYAEGIPVGEKFPEASINHRFKIIIDQLKEKLI